MASAYFPNTHPLKINDGSVAAPAYTFTGDTDTGIYRTGTEAGGDVAVNVAVDGVLRATFIETGYTELPGIVTVGTLRVTSSGVAALNVEDGNVNLEDGDLSVDGAITCTGEVDANTVDSVGAVSAGTLTINSGSITDTSGDISFGDDNLSTTTGTLTVGGAATFNAGVEIVGSDLLIPSADFSVGSIFSGGSGDDGMTDPKFKVLQATGNTTIAGTLGVTGEITGNASSATTAAACTGNSATASSASTALKLTTNPISGDSDGNKDYNIGWVFHGGGVPDAYSDNTAYEIRVDNANGPKYNPTNDTFSAKNISINSGGGLQMNGEDLFLAGGHLRNGLSGTFTGALNCASLTSTGIVTADSLILGATADNQPSSTSASGTKGDLRFGTAGGTVYLYICFETNGWRRVALSSWT
jgi:hypothetical protein